MRNLHTIILDRFLSATDIHQLEEADQFVRELKFMCNDFITNCPIHLYKSVPTDKQPSSFFRSKNRHRTVNESGSLLNQALQQQRMFERGLDVDAINDNDDSCIIFLPDAFRVSFSHVTMQSFSESATHVDSTELASIVYQHDVLALTEQAQHIIVSNVPFYYCLRFK